MTQQSFFKKFVYKVFPKTLLSLTLFSTLSLEAFDGFGHPRLQNQRTNPSVPESKKSNYLILTFDGGGIRGALTLKLLLMLNEETDFLKNIDLFAGTSTGSFIAAGMALGKSPNEILDLYVKHGSEIFSPAHSADPLGLHAKYNRESLRAIMESTSFPESLIFSSMPKRVVVPSFKLESENKKSWAPFIFDSFDKSLHPLIDVLLSSSAAPTYFPSYKGFIDGGVVANNPSLVALCAALDPSKENIDLNRIYMLSLGTGRSKELIEGDVDWGTAEWVIYSPATDKNTPSHPLIDLLCDSSSSLASMQSEQLLSGRYRRLNPHIHENITLDDWQDVGKLIQTAEDYPKKHPQEWNNLVSWVKENFCKK